MKINSPAIRPNSGAGGDQIYGVRESHLREPGAQLGLSEMHGDESKLNYEVNVQRRLIPPKTGSVWPARLVGMHIL